MNTDDVNRAVNRAGAVATARADVGQAFEHSDHDLAKTARLAISRPRQDFLIYQ
jgi:hypothetical protein